jgi:malonate decarboxylase alpha subunit
VCAEQADAEGNLYTGPNTEDTPVIVEAAAFHDGIVIVQVNQIVDKLPRVDIPASWIDVVIEADRPFAIEPLFTRDPRHIDELQILIGMMVIRGIYERHQVHSLNHGIGFDTVAIELLLPTYGESLGLRGKICEHWALNPHPTMIPAIESGWVKAFTVSAAKLEWIDTLRHVRISFLPAEMAASVRTGFCVSLQDSMQLMDLSVRRCRWMPTQTLRL